MKDTFRKICPKCNAPNFYFREFCMMCDTALDRSGRTRPEPKIHTGEDVRPEDKLAFRNAPIKEKQPSSIIQALVRIELGRKKIQESGGRVPNVRPGHVLGLLAFLVLVLGAFLASVPFGFLMLVLLCVLLILPLRDIGLYFIRHRVITVGFILIFLACVGGYVFLPKWIIRKWWRTSPIRLAELQAQDWFFRGGSPGGGSVSPTGAFYFVQEFAWPGAEKIKYLWPMKSQGACEDLLHRNVNAGVAGPSIAETCIPDGGQFDDFFLREAGPDWYVSFEYLGRITNVAIFMLNDRLLALGPESVFQTVWLFAQSALAVMAKETSSAQVKVRVFSPEGEVDALTGKLKK